MPCSLNDAGSLSITLSNREGPSSSRGLFGDGEAAVGKGIFAAEVAVGRANVTVGVGVAWA